MIAHFLFGWIASFAASHALIIALIAAGVLAGVIFAFVPLASSSPGTVLSLALACGVLTYCLILKWEDSDLQAQLTDCGKKVTALTDSLNKQNLAVAKLSQESQDRLKQAQAVVDAGKWSTATAQKDAARVLKSTHLPSVTACAASDALILKEVK